MFKFFALQRGVTGPFTLCCGLVLTFLSIPVYAADFSVSARQVKTATLNSSGANVDYSLQAKFANQAPRYKSVKVSHTPGKVVSLASARKAVNPAAAAVNVVVVGAIAAAGWVIDDLTGQVSTSNVNGLPVQDDSYDPGYFYAATSQGVVYKNISANTACSQMGAHFGQNVWGNSGGCYRVSNNNNYGTIGKYSCSESWAPAGCANPDFFVPESIPDSEWWPVVRDAIEGMSEEAQREFWNNTAGMPELTPELQAALDDFQQGLETETGLAGESLEETTSDVAQDVQDVRVIEPVQVDATGVDALDSSTQNFKDYFDSLIPQITDESLPSLPALAPLPDLPQETQCLEFSYEILDYGVLEIPGELGCAAFETRKDMYGWYMTVITFFICIGILIKPGSQGV
ncbi:MAG: hypothetical protein K6L74_07520 [Neptuniibacter sp.]